MKKVLNIGNRNSVFQKAEINFSYGNLTWENGQKVVTNDSPIASY